MSVGCHITDGCGLHTASRSPLHRLRCGQAGGPQTARWPVRCKVYKALAVNETQGHAGHYKVNSTSPVTHYTPAAAHDSIAHHPYIDTIAHIGDIHTLGCASKLASVRTVN